MRQQIDVTVLVTFDADASLSRRHLEAALQNYLTERVVISYEQEGMPVEPVRIEITEIKEEAEIYGNV